MDEAECAVIPNIWKYRMEICVSTGRASLSPVELERIEAHWSKKRRANPALFNGITYTVERLTCSGQALRIDMALSDYAHYLYTNDCEGTEKPCCMVAAGALLLTRDGHYVMGRMAEHTSFPGIVQCVGGGIEAQDSASPDSGRIDPARTLAREVLEETGLKLRFPEAESAPKYFISRKNRSLLGACYTLRLDMDLGEVLSAFERFQALPGPKRELSELVAVRRDRGAIDAFLTGCPNRVDYLRQVLLGECEAALDDLTVEAIMDAPSR